MGVDTRIFQKQVTRAITSESQISDKYTYFVSLDHIDLMMMLVMMEPPLYLPEHKSRPHAICGHLPLYIVFLRTYTFVTLPVYSCKNLSSVWSICSFLMVVISRRQEKVMLGG